MRTDRISFIRTRNESVETFRCRETGVCYQLELLDSTYIVSNSGAFVSVRHDRLVALALIEQLAALDFATAQAESAWAICDIELDGRFAV